MTDSSSVVLLPSTAEVCSTLASSMMVWSGGQMNIAYEHIHVCINVRKQLFLTHDVSLLVPCCFLSWHLRVLQILQELIQTVSLSTFPPLPQLVRYQWSQTPCEHLEGAKEADRGNMQVDTAVESWTLSMVMLPSAAWRSREAERGERKASRLLRSPSTSSASWWEVPGPAWWRCQSNQTAVRGWFYCPAPSRCPRSASSFASPWSPSLHRPQGGGDESVQ